MAPDVDSSLFRELVEQAALAVVVVDAGGRLVYANQAITAMLGFLPSELVGQPIEILLPGRFHEVHEGHRNQFLSQPERRPMGKGRELLARTKSGAEVRVEIGLYPLERAEGRWVAAVVVDITERLRQQEINERHDRLESVGFLAGGLAHDYNNVLAGILGNVDLLAWQLDATPKNHEKIEAIRRLVGKGSQIARRLITFSKGGTPVTGLHDLGPLIRDAAETAVSGTGVALQWLHPEAPLLAKVDPGQVGQVVTNLVINAVQAMEGRGSVRVSADAVSLPSGGHILLEVHDTGPGIPDELQAKVFDPFFTSKPKGTGLGLAIVHSIVEQHGGTMALRSSSEAGTTFSVLLPAAEAGAPSELISRELPPDMSCRDGGRVLVMDDNNDLRNTLAGALESCGFEVTACASGEEALGWVQVASAEGRPFQAAVLDVVVPGRLGGLDVIERLQARHDPLRVILMSGYSEADLDKSVGSGHPVFLSKPFALAQLVRAVEELVGRPEGRDSSSPGLPD